MTSLESTLSGVPTQHSTFNLADTMFSNLHMLALVIGQFVWCNFWEGFDRIDFAFNICNIFYSKCLLYQGFKAVFT